MKYLSLTAIALLFAFSPVAHADEKEQQSLKEKAATTATNQGAKGPSKLLGAPVNIGMGGGAVLPQGRAITALNTSLRDKTHAVNGGDKAPDVFSQIWLLKLRYGLTDRLEITTVPSYVHNRRDNASPKYIEGYGDQTLGLSYAIFSERAGDPLWLAISPSVILPTGQRGDSHLPGAGVFGGRVAVGLTKSFTQNIKGDMDFVWQGVFERGNQDVKSGNHYIWNAQARYMFSALPVDVGIESMLVKIESGDKQFPGGAIRNLGNGSIEWSVGPSFNVAIEPLGMWLGFGAFVPLYRDADGPTKMENIRYEFKIAKFW
jgi:hypothetical protein